jgi:hypothetical protein
MTEVERLRRRVEELESAIRWVVTQQADDLCWMDVYQTLGAMVGVPFDPTMLPPPVFLENCRRYESSLRSGLPYSPSRPVSE